jgi:hypothetical protein
MPLLQKREDGFDQLLSGGSGTKTRTKHLSTFVTVGDEPINNQILI